MTGELAALNTNWLDTTTVSASNSIGGLTSTTAGTVVSNNCVISDVYRYPWYTYVPSYVASRPIRLTLKDVERLRLAAKRDAKLKAILEKFTDQIEVELSFE